MLGRLCVVFTKNFYNDHWLLAGGLFFVVNYDRYCELIVLKPTASFPTLNMVEFFV
ncbi:hypothetical protein [Anaerococcus rubeinfantis]|uniref:hypothetical protein n=1 Tax=Anaerococcus rubeinfantis TaxID=1720199 RepID=UPI000A876F81|nr:hypothetical protein [Anaerococcus rubeinfantis]